MADSNLNRTASHTWRFFRAGGFDQVQLDTGSDLIALPELDQKLWVAISCPVKGVEFDKRTLELIDTDMDGHIRPPELLDAFAWVGKRLKNPDILVAAADGVPLAEINPDTEEGSALLASVRTILLSLGKEYSDRVSIEDACDTEKIFSNTRFNGDGVVTEASTDNEVLKEWIRQIIDCFGGEPDRSGEPGVSGSMLERFTAEASAWIIWQDEALNDTEGGLSANGLESALQLWDEVNSKIEDYFIRCSMADYDDRASIAMNASEDVLQQLAPKNLAESADDIASLPLSAVTPEQQLNLTRGLNPAWAGRIKLFRELIIKPLLGDVTLLTANDWATVKERCTDYGEWWSKRVDSPVAQLGRDRLASWIGGAATSEISALIEQDLALKSEFESIVDVERFTRYCRDLYSLSNNFVSFRDFYSGRGKGIFQVGTLYLDGRSCELTVPVVDVAKHATLANLSRVFLVYCDCQRDGGNQKMTIAAAITNGDSDQLVVGRNGVFYDRQGLDWDATVVRIVDHPISIRQAFWAPYKRIGKMVGEQIQKMAAAKSKAAEDKAAASLVQAGTPPKDVAKPTAQQQMFDVGKFAGIFAAIGLAVGAIGTAIASVVTGFLKLPGWQMPLAVAGILMMISGPSVIIAWFKLHQRNLGPILDANGWAVNARARLNIPFGASLTGIPRLPEGAKHSLSDPYAEKKRPWKSYLLLVVIFFAIFMAWKNGYIKIPITCTVTPSAVKPPLK